MITQNSEVYNPGPLQRSFSIYVYNEERYVWGIAYFTVLCDHPYLVSLLFTVLVPVTFLITCLCNFLAAGACLS